MLELAGGRDAPRRYQLKDLQERPRKVEALRGPFRMVGLYDGAGFKECRTGLPGGLRDTRAAENLKDDFLKGQGSAVLVVDRRPVRGRARNAARAAPGLGARCAHLSQLDFDAMENQRIVLASRPEGWVTPDRISASRKARCRSSATARSW